MRNFQGHNPEKGMVHPRKRSRKRLITSDSDDDDDYTDKDYSIEEDASKQLVLYDPQTTRRQQKEFQLAEPIYDSTPLQQIPPKTKYGGHSRVLPSIGHYTVQCAQCFKWRVVPTKEKYEELRETISEELFVCTRAREWNRVLSCNDPEDMSQDGSKVWAIGKPNIAQTPLGWDREVRIRGEGCSKFADVYYTSPAGVTLRSMVEIERYLAENPFYVRQGVYLGQFSFATPKPLEEGYVRKRKYSATTRELPGILEPVEGSRRDDGPPGVRVRPRRRRAGGEPPPPPPRASTAPGRGFSFTHICALAPASTSVADLRDALLHRLRLRRAAHASPPPSAPRGIGPLPLACAAPESPDLLDFLTPGAPPSSPSPHRVARCAASASTAHEPLCAGPPRWIGQLFRAYAASAVSTARVARRCRRRLGVGVEESLGRSCRLGLQEASAPLGALSGSVSTGPLQMGLYPCLTPKPLLTHRMNSMAMLPSSLAVLPPEKPDEDEIPGPVLIITNLELPRSILFSPYTMRTFSSSFPVDTADVLYSNGYFILLKEGTYVSVWEVKSEKRLLNFHVGVEIEQGYFNGTPGSDLTVVLARQRIFAEVNVDDNADEGGGEADIVTEFWLRTTDGVWQQNAVVCGHLGIHSLIIHQSALFWLSDDGCLCSVTQDEDGLLHLIEWEGAVEAIGNSFSLIENLGSLYIVKSGGVLPNLAGIYRVIPGDPPAFPETRMVGKDVFMVHGRSGIVLPNRTDDSRVFTAPLIEDADCSWFSYKHNRHDNIRPCEGEVFHMWCSAAWVVMQPGL